MAGHRRIRSPQGTGGNGSVEVAARLAELVDVTITSAAAGDYLRHNGTAWVDVGAAQIIADINGGLVHNSLSGLTTGDPHTQYALLAGRSGGQTLKGGTAALDNLYLQSTSHATKGGVYVDSSLLFFVSSGDGVIRGAAGLQMHPTTGLLKVYDNAYTNSLNLSHSTDGIIATSTGDLQLNPATGFVGINKSSPAFPLDVAATVTNTVRFYTTNDNSNGVSVHIIQDSASPADNDKVGTFYFLADDDTGTQRVIGRIAMKFDDVTSTTMDSSMIFSTQDAVNAGDYNKNATLTSLGVWTDASSEEGKRFEGVIPGVLEKLRLLDVQKYRSANVSGAKVASAERHCSPSAENFWDVFGLGVDPRRVHQDKDGRQFKKAGIAPKDLAGVALLGLKEADTKIVALEQRVAALEAA